MCILLDACRFLTPNKNRQNISVHWTCQLLCDIVPWFAERDTCHWTQARQGAQGGLVKAWFDVIFLFETAFNSMQSLFFKT